MRLKSDMALLKTLFRKISHRDYFLILSFLFAIEWLWLAISPYHRADWALENLLVFVGIAFLLLTYHRIPLSRISYTMVFLFLSIHAIGAHYTYAMVPYNEWSMNLFGFSLNEVLGWERNNFDRVTHFLYGLLLAYPIRELYFRVVDVDGFWGYFLPLDLAMSTSALFELFEWGAAEIVGGDLGMAYLGTQGDIWDAHKDMALASLGALISMTITLYFNARFQTDFAKEWSRSFTVKHKRPLGEDEIYRLWQRNKNKKTSGEAAKE